MTLLGWTSLLTTKLPLCFFILPLVMAQDSSTSPSTASPTSLPSSTTSDWMPTPTDSAGQSQGSQNTVSLVNYYFVFLALIIIGACVAAFFMWKRKRRYGTIIRQSRETALARDVHAFDPVRSRGRYWQGRWRSTDMSREEGLNEHGEAPPPYIPKSEDMEAGGHGEGSGPAVPLQTLSREQAGLKPPDYSEVGVHPVGGSGGTPTAAAGSSSAHHSERYG